MYNTTTIAEMLGSYVAGANLATVPPHVREKAKLCLLDSLGCMVGGATLAPGRMVADMVRAWGGAPEASLMAVDDKVPAPWAAYVNGYLANLLDMDDTVSLGHPGSTVVPTALALGEWHHGPGRELLLALIVGYEVALRVGIAVSPSPERERSVRGMGTWQIFGATAVAARLLGLDGNQAAHALALAVNHAPVPCIKKFGYRARPISWIKNNLGWANLGGILAARHAGQGMTANLTNFEGANGFWVMAGADKADFVTYAKGLGQEYHVLGVAFKSYPACWGPHPTLDAVQTLVQRHDIQVGEVRRIVVSGARSLLNFFDSAPQTIPDAQFSIPYPVAMLLLRQPPGYAWFTEENMHSPEVRAVASKVEFVHDEEAEVEFSSRNLKRLVRVRIELEGDRSVEEVVEATRGDPERPLSAQEVKDKYLGLTAPVLGATKAQRLLGLVEDLEQLDDTAKLAELFAVTERNS
jgi:2-methylcitrate dehydratase PrpD